jgi:hypothetical protein
MAAIAMDKCATLRDPWCVMLGLRGRALHGGAVCGHTRHNIGLRVLR